MILSATHHQRAPIWLKVSLEFVEMLGDLFFWAAADYATWDLTWFQKSYREIRKKSSKGSKACFSMIFVLWCNLLHDFNILGGRVAFSIIADKIKQLLSYSIKKIWEIFMNGQILKNGIYWKKYAKKNFFSRENRILKVLAGRQSAGW